jgi:hypothetical protein
VFGWDVTMGLLDIVVIDASYVYFQMLQVISFMIYLFFLLIKYEQLIKV